MYESQEGNKCMRSFCENQLRQYNIQGTLDQDKINDSLIDKKKNDMHWPVQFVVRLHSQQMDSTTSSFSSSSSSSDLIPRADQAHVSSFDGLKQNFASSIIGVTSESHRVGCDPGFHLFV